nr:antigen WC1.1-like [Cavia porcellus]
MIQEEYRELEKDLIDEQNNRYIEHDKGIPQLHLAEGAHRCVGRVEILHQGSWATICDDSWSTSETHVVCRQIGCGVATSATLNDYFGSRPDSIHLNAPGCTGDETHLWHCPSWSWDQHSCTRWPAVGVICSGFVRLGGSFGLCSGRVEVNSGRGWILVSDVNFTFPTSQVICAELGCGKALSVLGNLSRNASEQVWSEEFQCEGQEPEVWLCPRVPCPGSSCHHGGGVEVICAEYTEVRLTKNRTSHCEGQVEMNSSEGWKALCASHWSMANAKVVCRQLGCGNAIAVPKGGAYFVEGGNEIWKDRFHCSGDESFLWRCPVTTLGVPACAHGNTASVVCSGNQTQLLPQGNDFLSDPGSTVSKDLASSFSDNGQLRLVDGGGRCAGRVEVQHDGSWGTVCDDSWDLRDAHVVCRQLGCGVALNATVSAHFGQGSGPIWLDELNCTGDESHLWNCPSQGWGQHDCRHKEDVGVICSEFLALRLISKDQECAGWLEVFYNGTWGSICRSPMEATTLSIICSQLGCGDSGTLNYFISPREGSRLQWVDGIKCRKTDTSLWQCPSNAWKHRSCLPRDEAYITCAEQRFKSCPTTAPCTEKQKLRLVGGNSECSGRVEVWHEGSWGTVCDDSWDLAEAEVVCQQLGCGPALEALGKAAFGPGNGSIWLDEVQCRGRESSLWACARAPWGQSDCKHEEDAGVKCLGEMTTVSPTSRNASSVSAPGVFSLPVIICIILGALLFLVLVILGTQLHRWRAELQALPTFEDPLDEALYEEINYIIKPQKEVLFDNPEPLAQHVDVAGNGYDDVEELPAPKVPSSPEMSEMHFPSEDRDGTRNSQSGASLLTVASIPPQALKEAANYRIEEKEFSLFLRQEDPGYDDVELNAM